MLEENELLYCWHGLFDCEWLHWSRHCIQAVLEDSKKYYSTYNSITSTDMPRSWIQEWTCKESKWFSFEVWELYDKVVKRFSWFESQRYSRKISTSSIISWRIAGRLGTYQFRMHLFTNRLTFASKSHTEYRLKGKHHIRRRQLYR